MNYGLLQCDHVLEQFRPIAGDYQDMFAGWLPGAWRVYDLPAGQAPTGLDECDAYVTTGSRFSVYDDEPWIHAFAALVRRIHAAGKPFLGVCFGHQMMGHALGGRVEKSSRGWGVGVHRFQVHHAEPWMQPPAPSFHVLMSCQDQVSILPPGATVLAGDDHCPVGMFRLGSLLGIQGHPEWSPAYAEALLRHRRDRIGPAVVDAALASLSQPLDGTLLRDWTERFLTAARSPGVNSPR
jgi:GMP synthase-like glutamine amidotransferase